MAFKFNPFTGTFDISFNGSSVPSFETDPLSLHLDQTTPQTVTGGQPVFAAGVNTSYSLEFTGHENRNAQQNMVSIGNGSVNPVIIMQRTRGTILTPSAVQDGDTIAKFDFRTMGPSSAYPDPENASISVIVDGVPQLEDYAPLKMVFSTKPATSFLVGFKDSTVQLPYYTSNGFLKTSASNGTLTVDTTTYLASGSALLLDQTSPQSVINGGPVFTCTTCFTGTVGIEVGKDATGGSLNTPGRIQLWANGDNAFCTKLMAGTNTASYDLCLPTALPTDSNSIAVVSSVGQLSWAGIGFASTCLCSPMLCGTSYVYSPTICASIISCSPCFVGMLGESTFRCVAIGMDCTAGSSNINGVIKMWSAGDNDFTTCIATPTQTASYTISLPTAMTSTSNSILVTSSTGQLSFAGIGYASTCLCSPVLCGSTSICGATICGTTVVCSPTICGSTAVCGATVCGTTVVCSPTICGSTAVCGSLICGITSVCSPSVCGSTTVCGATICGGTIVRSPSICGSTSVCGGLVCGTCHLGTCCYGVACCCYPYFVNSIRLVTLQGSSGSENFLGGQSGNFSMTGACNVLIGYLAGNALTSGYNNQMFGYQAGCKTTSGCDNFYSGACAGGLFTTGCSNTFIGCMAGCGISGFSTGSHNVAIGCFAGSKLCSAAGNILLGQSAGCQVCSGACNIMIGCFSGCCTTTSSCNIFLGGLAGQCLTSGSGNIAIGHNTAIGGASASGANNVWLGVLAGRCTTTAACGVSVGLCAGFCNTTGAGNVFLGPCAGYANIAASSGVFIGVGAGYCSNAATACYSVMIGANAGQLNQGCANVYINACAGCGVTPAAGVCSNGTDNFAVGQLALSKITCGTDNISIGKCSGICNSCGSNNINLGACSGACNTASSNSIKIGLSAGYYATGCSNILMGYLAGCGCSIGFSGADNIVIGCVSGQALYSGSCNIFLGQSSGMCVNSGCQNIYLGHLTGCCTCSGCYNTFVGSAAGSCNCTGCYNVGIGSFAGKYNTSCCMFYVDVVDRMNSASECSCALLWGCFNSSGDTQLLKTAARLAICSTNSAWLTLAAGRTSAGFAPLKFNTGSNLSMQEAGAMEYDGTQLYFTNSSPLRNIVAMICGTMAPSTGYVPYASATSGYLLSCSNLTFNGSLLSVTGCTCSSVCSCSPILCATSCVSSPCYYAGISAGIDATVSYTDSLLGARTLCFCKGILISQA